MFPPVELECIAKEGDHLLIRPETEGLLARPGQVFDGLLRVLGQPPVMDQQGIERRHIVRTGVLEPLGDHPVQLTPLGEQQ